MPDLTLKDSLGIKTLAKKIDISAAVATGINSVVGNVNYKQVVVKGKDNPSEGAPETEDTGFVEETVLAELTESTVQIPQNFAGLESVMVPTRLRNQLFEITEVHEMDGYVEITAVHIFYRQRQNYTLWNPNENTNYSGASAIRNVMTNTLFPTEFKVASDSEEMIRGNELDYERMNIVEAFLNPESGICARYGLSMIRDNETFYCLKDVGYDRGFVVQNKKNMLGVERTESIEDVITRVAPVGRDEDGNYVWLNLNGVKYIDSPHISEYATPKAEIYITDIEIGRDGTTAENIQDKLYEAAQKRFDEDEVDVPTVSMTVQFISLGDTEEYKQFKDLDKVYLYDVIHIKDTERGYSYGAQVIAVQHNVLTGLLESVTIGTPQPWDGVRKIGAWQVPEITGGKIRHGSIRTSELADSSVTGQKLADGSVGASHMSQSADGHFINIFGEQLEISNTSEDGLLHTRFSVTEGLIQSEVTRATSAEGAMGTLITQNAEAISLEALRANSVEGELRSEILVTASMIMSSVSSNNSAIYSEVVQTANMIRSEVNNTLSNFYTEIIQTASGVVIRTGDNNRTYSQRTEPTGTAQNPLVDGDVWFNSAGKFTWGDAEGDSWLDNSSESWQSMKTADVYRYNGVTGQWEQIINETAVMQDTKFEQNKERIQLVAGRVDAVDGKVESYRGEFEVRADQITASVQEQVNGLGSRITQTAREIRSEVFAENSQLYSEIIQTATMIYAHVADEKAGLHSEIVQTASMIRSSVNASNSQIYSTITQTASAIRSEVRNTTSGIYSTITQTASAIRLEVRNTTSSIRSSITQEANRINLVVQGTGSNARIKSASIVTAINQDGSSVVISADHIELDGYVKATDITADFIKNKVSLADTISVKKLSVNTSVAFANGATITSAQSADIIRNLRIQQSGDTYKLQKITCGDPSWTDVGSFSRATSLTGAWGSGVFTVSASPQGNSLVTSLTVGAFSWSGLVATAKIYATIGSSGTVYETGKEASLDVSSVFTHLGHRELGYLDHGNFESVGNHDWFYR